MDERGQLLKRAKSAYSVGSKNVTKCLPRAANAKKTPTPASPSPEVSIKGINRTI